MTPRRFAAILTITAVAIGGVVVAQSQPARADRISVVPSGRTMLLAGHGWGHGHGMSQEGANGAAAVKHLSATSITSFYYPHTAAGSLPDPSSRFRVQLSQLSDNDLHLAKPTGSSAVVHLHDLASGASRDLPASVTKWAFTAGPSGRVLVYQWTSSGWKPYPSTGTQLSYAGPLSIGQLHATSPYPMRVLYPDGREKDYRGYLRVYWVNSGKIDIVNLVTMNEYLYGVVPRESPSSWPAAALQAQAIAARTYARWNIEHPRSANFDICDTTSCQVYGGAREVSTSGTVTPLEAASTNAAVNATSGRIRTYGGKAIFAQFSASNGGWSSDGGAPYLIAREDPYDGLSHSLSHSWRAAMPASALESRYPSIGTLRRVRVTKRDGNGDWGGRVLEAVLEGSAGSVTVTGSDIYTAYSWPAHSTGLRHYWFQILPLPPADFDGNAATDVSMWRASDGRWYFHDHGNVHWGTAGDIPAPGDYDGNGRSDPVVFRPSNGRWYVQGKPSVHWGTRGDIPVPGDYDGNGTTDLTVWRPSNGRWYVSGKPKVHWGTRGDIPAPADYNGDGITEMALWRPSNGRLYRFGKASVHWGIRGDIPVPGDYNGNGLSEFAVWRKSNGRYYIPGRDPIHWGELGDVPVPGDYTRDGITDVVMYRPSTLTWYVRGGANTRFGLAGDEPLPLPYAIYRSR
jgi:SpoIID/LytB domain protein